MKMSFFDNILSIKNEYRLSSDNIYLAKYKVITLFACLSYIIRRFVGGGGGNKD